MLKPKYLNLLWLGLLASVGFDLFQDFILDTHFQRQGNLSQVNEIFISISYLSLITLLGLAAFTILLRFPNLVKIIDPAYAGIQFPKWDKFLLSAVLSGFAGAATSVVTMYGFQKLDAGLLAGVVGASKLILIIFRDVVMGKVRIRQMIAPAILTVAGVFTMSGPSFEQIDVGALVGIAVATGLLGLLDEHFNHSCDLSQTSSSSQYIYWRFLFATVGAQAIAVFVLLPSGNAQAYFQVATRGWPVAFCLMTLSVTIMLTGQIWTKQAREGVKLSVLNLIFNSQILLTTIGGWILGFFLSSFADDPTFSSIELFGQKLIGGVLIVAGILLVKALIKED